MRTSSVGQITEETWRITKDGEDILPGNAVCSQVILVAFIEFQLDGFNIIWFTDHTANCNTYTSYAARYASLPSSAILRTVHFQTTRRLDMPRPGPRIHVDRRTGVFAASLSLEVRARRHSLSGEAAVPHHPPRRSAPPSV